MFTGIIETLGEVKAIEQDQKNVHFTIKSSLTHELKIDQSVAHNGCCLTVVGIEGDEYVVTAIKETMDRTNLGEWKVGDKVNVERCTQMNGRLDGHIVQGHVDTTAKVVKVENEAGSWKVHFEFAEGVDQVTVEKGSITVNGVSLTVVDSHKTGFSVAIIPYTWEETNFHAFSPGSTANIEFDIVGKYVKRLLEMREA